MKKLFDYFASRRAMLALYALSVLTVLLLGYLARQEMTYVRYTCIIISFVSSAPFSKSVQFSLIQQT